MDAFTYRTFNPTPTPYERDLADALFEIMGRHVHDADGIAAALNDSGPKPPGAGEWTAERLKAEMRRLGSWTNAIGAPVGEHAIPATGERMNGDGS